MLIRERGTKKITETLTSYHKALDLSSGMQKPHPLFGSFSGAL